MVVRGSGNPRLRLRRAARRCAVRDGLGDDRYGPSPVAAPDAPEQRGAVRGVGRPRSGEVDDGRGQVRGLDRVVPVAPGYAGAGETRGTRIDGS